MAAKPVIKNVIPFDVSQGTTLYAQYTGNIPYYNRVVIQDSVALTTVYSRYIKSSLLEHVVDPNYTGGEVATGDVGYSLVNGRRYTATIQFFDKDQNPGIISDKISFVTRTTPAFYFADLNNGDVIGSPSITLDLRYSQQEAEPLDSYRFSIYGNNKKLLQETDIFYDTSNMTYTFKGLENFEFYYVRATGVTRNKISLDTGYVEIQIYFENPSVFSILQTECDTFNSSIKYDTNYVLIEADEGNDFKYKDSYIYIEDDKITYSKGFNIEGDALWHIRGKDMDYERVILRCWNNEGEFWVESLRDSDYRLIFRLVAPGALSRYIIYSQPIYIDWMDVVDIWIRRKKVDGAGTGFLYQIKVIVEDRKKNMGNMHLMVEDPTLLSENDVWITLNEHHTVPEEEVRIIYSEEEPEENVVQWNTWLGKE